MHYISMWWGIVTAGDGKTIALVFLVGTWLWANNWFREVDPFSKHSSSFHQNTVLQVIDDDMLWEEIWALGSSILYKKITADIKEIAESPLS